MYFLFIILSLQNGAVYASIRGVGAYFTMPNPKDRFPGIIFPILKSRISAIFYFPLMSNSNGGLLWHWCRCG